MNAFNLGVGIWSKEDKVLHVFSMMIQVLHNSVSLSVQFLPILDCWYYFS